jgi:hypothetical protein
MADDRAAPYPPRVTLSFPIEDLPKSVPEATGLDGLSGDVLIDALRKVLGKLADGAAISVTDGVVTLDFGEVPASNVLEAQRLYLEAAPVRARASSRKRLRSIAGSSNSTRTGRTPGLSGRWCC